MCIRDRHHAAPCRAAPRRARRAAPSRGGAPHAPVSSRASPSCTDPAFRLNDISLTIFKPVKPRLSARGEWADIPKLVGKKGRIAVEYKLDGERLLLHWE
eukprot:428556-Prymnesium_polylepis.1